MNGNRNGVRIDAWGMLEEGFEALTMLPQVVEAAGAHHLEDTPKRVVKMYREELLAGCWIDPSIVLGKTFPTKSTDMVQVMDVSFVSLCAHHLVPFAGKAHFAYIPAGNIVGLSKIPRMIEALAKRPQVQEELTTQILDTFEFTVKPAGCAVVIEAMHFCMAIRGVKKENAYTRTSGVRGIFRENHDTKDEFMNSIKKSEKLWP